MTDKIQSMLPRHITVDRFKRTIMTAVNMNPDLQNADRRSLYNSALKAASDGLLPDGREGALVIFKTKQKKRLDNGQIQEQWIQAVQWMPMVFGIIKKLRQSGEIASITARCVYQKEIDQGRFEFKIIDGEEKLTHDPILVGERGKIVLAYATARFKDGTVQNEPLTLDDIEKARSVSKTGKSEFGPWANWYDEMARKTAIRRLAKYLPLSAEDMRVFEHDDPESRSDFEQMKAEALKAAPQSISRAAAALSAPVATIDAGDGERADAETGEVLEGDATAGSEETGDPAGDDEGAFTDAEPNTTTPTITKIEVPTTTDGQPIWKSWAEAAKNAIPLLDAGQVAAWRQVHADEMKALNGVSKKLLGEVEAALAAKDKEAA